MARKRATATDWARWEDAIELFNLANTDSYLITAELEAVLMVSSFQRVLGVRSSKHIAVAQAFAAALRPSSDLALAASRRAANLPDVGKKEPNLRTRWMEDFYGLRGDLAHGRMRSSKDLLWRDPREFLVLGAFAFPLVVKQLLEDEGLYQLTDEDHIRVDAFERLADAEFLTCVKTESGGEEWPWTRILWDVRYGGLFSP